MLDGWNDTFRLREGAKLGAACLLLLMRLGGVDFAPGLEGKKIASPTHRCPDSHVFFSNAGEWEEILTLLLSLLPYVNGANTLFNML